MCAKKSGTDVNYFKKKIKINNIVYFTLYLPFLIK